MPLWMMRCPACGGCVGNGCCAACGVQVFEPLPQWQIAVLAVAVAFVIAAQCVAAPFYLAFVLGHALRLLWLSRGRGGRF